MPKCKHNDFLEDCEICGSTDKCVKCSAPTVVNLINGTCDCDI